MRDGSFPLAPCYFMYHDYLGTYRCFLIDDVASCPSRQTSALHVPGGNLATARCQNTWIPDKVTLTVAISTRGQQEARELGNVLEPYTLPWRRRVP